MSRTNPTGGGGDGPPPPKPSTQIEALAERNALEISWPNVPRVDIVVKPVLAVDWQKMLILRVDPAQIHVSADLAPALGGAADLSQAVSIDLEKLPEEFRPQRLLFVAARKAFAELKPNFTGNLEYLMVQLIRLSEQFFESDRLAIPSLFHQEPLRKRILIALSMDRIVQHVLAHVHERNFERMEPVFDQENPIGSTRAMRTWYSTKRCMETSKSQISHVVGEHLGALHGQRAGRNGGSRRLRQERPPGLPDPLPVERQPPALRAGLHHPPEQRQDAGAGDQGRGQRPEQGQTLGARCLGAGGQCQGRFRRLVLGRGVRTGEDSGHRDFAHGQ